MVDGIKQAVSNLATAIINTSRQTHAGFVLSSVAVLEHDLERCLLAQMRPLTANIRKRLFSGYGPVSTFSAKMDLAFAFKILDPEAYEEALKIKTIRNKFAHSKEILSLDKDPIIGTFNQLRRPKGVSGTYPEVFLACVIALDDRLERFLVSKGVVEDIRPENLNNLADGANPGQPRE